VDRIRDVHPPVVVCVRCVEALQGRRAAEKEESERLARIADVDGAVAVGVASPEPRPPLPGRERRPGRRHLADGDPALPIAQRLEAECPQPGHLARIARSAAKHQRRIAETDLGRVAHGADEPIENRDDRQLPIDGPRGQQVVGREAVARAVLRILLLHDPKELENGRLPQEDLIGVDRISGELHDRRIVADRKVEDVEVEGQPGLVVKCERHADDVPGSAGDGLCLEPELPRRAG
jgi:hypothetical protein